MNVVHYADLGKCRVGESAHVKPIDHPTKHLNGEWVTTTKVQAIEPTPNGPIFATRNTLYVPCEPEKERETYREREEA